MSTVLTLTPEPEVAAVLLEVTGAPAGPLEITRTDANGVAPVRLLPGQEPIGGALTVRDYEAALSGPIQYQLVGTRTNELINPGFEIDTSGWTVTGTGAVLTRDTTVVWNGAASAKVTIPSGSAFLQTTMATAAPASPGDTWQLAATMRALTGFVYDLRVIDQAGATVFNAPGTETGADTWRFHQYAFVVTPGATSLRAQFTLTGTNAVMYEDRVLLERADTYDGYIEGTVTATITATTTLDVASPVLHAAVLPHLRQSLELITGYDSRRDSGGSVHYVEGRQDAIVVTKPMRLREGSVTLHASTFEQARAIEEIAAPGEVLMLRQPDNAGMDMYFIARSGGSRPKSENTTPKRWSVDIDYVEQRSPSGPLAGAAGWNFAEHTALGLTFAQSKVQFPTFNDRVAGP